MFPLTWGFMWAASIILMSPAVAAFVYNASL